MQDTTLFTVTSGVIGGISKALMSGFTMIRISMESLFEVAIYAFVSATVGYGVKFFYDKLRDNNQHKQLKH